MQRSDEDKNGEMARWLRVLVALLGVQGSIPSTHL